MCHLPLKTHPMWSPTLAFLPDWCWDPSPSAKQTSPILWSPTRFDPHICWAHSSISTHFCLSEGHMTSSCFSSADHPDPAVASKHRSSSIQFTGNAAIRPPRLRTTASRRPDCRGSRLQTRRRTSNGVGTRVEMASLVPVWHVPGGVRRIVDLSEKRQFPPTKVAPLART